MTTFTHPLIAYAEPAKAGAGALRTLFGIALVTVFVACFIQVAKVGVASILIGPDGRADDLDSSTAIGVLLRLGPFVAVWPALWLILPLVHKRPAATLFSTDGAVNWRHFRIGLGISMALGAAAWAPLLLTRQDEIGLLAPMSAWLTLAAIGLPLVFVQCAAEEMLVRGYLLQQFAARSFSVLGWSVLPSLLFAAAHPTESNWLGISWYHFVIGLIMAAVTSRTANLGAAIGLHFGNNVVNLLLVSPVGLVSGMALFQVPDSIDTSGSKITYLVVMFVGAALFMGYKDMTFLKAWRKAKLAERAHKAAVAAEPAKIAAE